jgi:hypothetical protein
MTAPNPVPAPGAAGTGGTPPGQAPADGQPQNDDGTPPAPAPGATDPGQEAEDIDSLPEWAKKVIKKAREDAAAARTDKQTAAQAAAEAKEQRAAILKLFGLDEDGKETPLTEAEISAKIEQQADEIWATRVENVVLRIPGVNTAKLWDSRAFVDSLDQFTDLDPAQPDAAKKITEHVREYVKNHPEFEASAGPVRSGGDHPGGTKTVQPRPKSIQSAVANHYGQRRVN